MVSLATFEASMKDVARFSHVRGLRLLPLTGDVVVLHAEDDAAWRKRDHGVLGIASVDKTLAWYMHAVRVYPRARFIGRADDDAFINVRVVAHALRQLHSSLGGDVHAVAGWLQYTSFNRKTWHSCGWTMRAVDASKRSRDDPACRSGQGAEAQAHDVEGPYPFVAGNLELMTGRLALAAFGSERTRNFVAWGRAATRREGSPHWEAKDEDPIVGFLLQDTAVRERLNVTVVAYNGRGHMEPLVADIYKMARARPKRLASMLAIHRVEPDVALLQRRVAQEQLELAELARSNLSGQLNWAPILKLNKKLRPELERLADGKGAMMAQAARGKLTLVCDHTSALVRQAVLLSSFACCRSWRLCEHRYEDV